MTDICNHTGIVRALSMSALKGIPKTNVAMVNLLADWGIEGDAHAGKWHRQISLLATESIRKIQAKGLKVMPGEFAENITTEYTDLSQVVIGDRIHIGSTILEVTQIGKECHQRCHIYEQVGDCVMPREGIFARVIEGGRIWVGNPVLINPSKIHSEPTPQSHNHECSE